MTKENLKTGLIVVLLIATVVLAWKYCIYKVQVENRDVRSVHLELCSAFYVMDSAETEEDWEKGTQWISFANRAFPPYPQGEAAQRVLKVCEALPNLKFGSEEYEEVKALFADGFPINFKYSTFEVYFTIHDEAKFSRLEEILGIR